MKLWRTLKQWRKEAPAAGAPPEFGLQTWYRLTGWQKLLLVILCVLAYVLCVGPTFSSNVLPHMLATVNADGSLNGGEIVSSVYLIGAVILLTTAPLLIPHVAWHQAIGLAIMSLCIVYVNINNACGTIGHTRDVKADEPRQKIERIHRLDTKIEQLTKASQQVPEHRYVTKGLVDAAEKAAEELRKSAAEECGSGVIWSRRGPRCDALEKKRDAKLEEVAKLQADKDLTDRASSIEAELWKAKRQREAEGATPEHIDPETERFVGFLALLHIVTPDQAKAFSENKPVIDAICMELMAWFGTPCMSIGIFMLFGRMASSQREMDRRLIEVTQAVAEERAKNVVAAAEQGGIPKAPANDDAEMDPHSPEAVLEIEGEELPAFAKNPETVAEAAAGALLRADPHKMYGRKARKRKAPHKSSVIHFGHCSRSRAKLSGNSRKTIGEKRRNGEPGALQGTTVLVLNTHFGHDSCKLQQAVSG